MALAPAFRNLALPVIGAPMFIVSSPDLAVAGSHAGIDPSRLGRRDADTLAVSADGTKAKAWKDVWSAGHGVGALHDVPAVAVRVDRWCAALAVATRRLTG